MFPQVKRLSFQILRLSKYRCLFTGRNLENEFKSAENNSPQANSLNGESIHEPLLKKPLDDQKIEGNLSQERADKPKVEETDIRNTSHEYTFQENDPVLISQFKKFENYWFVDQLKDGKVLGIQKGDIEHSSIIGKKPRSLIEAKVAKNSKKSISLRFMITKPTLEQYVKLSRRIVQPIYHLDSTIITAMADIHPNYPILEKCDPDKDQSSSSFRLSQPPLQFLESGTGHGSLTLAISKLLHPSNAYAKLFDDLSLRGAILHTVDCNESHSNRGRKIVQGFNRGQYSHNVEYHVCDSPTSWLKSDRAKLWNLLENIGSQTSKISTEKVLPFLSGVFLDLPEPQRYVKEIARYMKEDSPMLIFQPSITQILEVLKSLKTDPNTEEQGMQVDDDASNRLTLVKVVELLPGIGAGLREWDLRTGLVVQSGENANETEDKIVDVCKPKFGVRVTAGGFVGLFKKYPKVQFHDK